MITYLFKKYFLANVVKTSQIPDALPNLQLHEDKKSIANVMVYGWALLKMHFGDCKEFCNVFSVAMFKLIEFLSYFFLISKENNGG